jgi:hypothetical protein
MENNQPLELFESTDSDWSQCHVFPAYTPRATMNEELGFRWRCVSRPDLSRSETQQILAFVDDEPSRELLRAPLRNANEWL